MNDHDWVELKNLLRKLNIKYGKITDADSREFYLKCVDYGLLDDIRIINDLLER